MVTNSQERKGPVCCTDRDLALWRLSFSQEATQELPDLLTSAGNNGPYAYSSHMPHIHIGGGEEKCS